MIRVTLSRIDVNSAPLFKPGASVNRWSHRIAAHVRGEARDLAPQPGGGRSVARHDSWATGRLVASIYSDVNAEPARRDITVRVGARVPHARYVHQGTANKGTGYISSTSGRPMPITRIPFVTGYANRVRGQFPNPFLVDAYNLVAAVHPALPHMSGN